MGMDAAAGLAGGWRRRASGHRLAVGRFLPCRKQPENSVAQLQGQVENLRQLVSLAMLNQSSPGSRLEGVVYAQQLARPDNEVEQALVQAARRDPNVNVRLAAVDGLGRYGSDPAVRRTLADGLLREESPLVQVALIELLVNAHARDCAVEMKQLAASPDAEPIVRQRAEWGLKQLGASRKGDRKSEETSHSDASVAPALVFGFHRDDNDDWRLEDRETMDRSFTVGGADAELAVHNFMGYVHVNGYDGNVIKIHTVKHMRAETKAGLGRCQAAGHARNDPGREPGAGEAHWPTSRRRPPPFFGLVRPRHRSSARFEARPEKLQPRHGGDARHARRFSGGNFQGRNRSGGYRGLRLGEEFQRAIRAVFIRNPERETSFHTFNGSVDVYLQKDLNADLHFKTFHGGVYTDFDLTMPAGQFSGHRWGSGGWNNARIGKGGPSFELRWLQRPHPRACKELGHESQL